MRRRDFLKAGTASATLATLPGCGGMPAFVGGAKRRVVVVGGGYGGATAARYVKLLDASIDVVLIEPNDAFVSCPLSNLVLGGFRGMAAITVAYTGLMRQGVHVVRDTATAIDVEKKLVRLANGAPVPFDRVILSPGIDFMWDQLPAMQDEQAQWRVPHAWKAGPQTTALRRQLEGMRDGGVFAISIPEMPYRCPPGPYERACLAAAYFKAAKPKSKVVIFDANPDITSKGALFRKAWTELYGGMIDYRPNNKAIDVDAATNTLKLEFGDERADVLNVLPPMKAGRIVDPFITVNRRWCEVDWLTYESHAAKGVHILGDSLQIAPLMPKSATMANGHAKVCAAAMVAMLRGQPPNPSPTLVNTCYSMVSDKMAIHVASVHKYDVAGQPTMRAVPGAGGLSTAMSEAEGAYAMNWARNIWADALG